MTLPNSQRAALDAYWTPDACALGCVRALAAVLPRAPRTILEPAAGGGSWVRAARAVWGKRPWIEAWDVDPKAPALTDDVGASMAHRHDYLTATPLDCDLVLGNPPYARAEFQAWLDRPLTHARAVAWLLRSTALGSGKRAAWWPANPPSHIWTLCTRPRWQGPGARPSSDAVDSVLVLWQPSLYRGGARVIPRHGWIDWRGADV